MSMQLTWYAARASGIVALGRGGRVGGVGPGPVHAGFGPKASPGVVVRSASVPGWPGTHVHRPARGGDPVGHLRPLQPGERAGAVHRDLAPGRGGVGDHGLLPPARRRAHLPGPGQDLEEGLAARALRQLRAVHREHRSRAGCRNGRELSGVGRRRRDRVRGGGRPHVGPSSNLARAASPHAGGVGGRPPTARASSTPGALSALPAGSGGILRVSG